MPSILSWHRFIVDQITGVFFHYFFEWRGYIYIRKLASICERNYRMIKDSIAESLEARGLYRRAASRWVDVMQTCVDDNDREWIRMHRNKCLKKAKLPPARKEEFADIHKAARETQYRMGIAKPNGEVFRLPAKKKATRR